MIRFPARRGVPESTIASFLRLATKYGPPDPREQLVEELKEPKEAHPIRWENYETAGVLGKGVSGSPKPHTDAVLNLFVAQNVGFAIPFAFCRASTGVLSAFMSDQPGTVLPRHTLASPIHMVPTTTRTIAFDINLGVCPERPCILSADVTPAKRRIEALGRLSDAMYGEGQGGVLNDPSLADVTCPRCTKPLEAWQAECRSGCWEIPPYQGPLYDSHSPSVTPRYSAVVTGDDDGLSSVSTSPTVLTPVSARIVWSTTIVGSSSMS